MPSETDVRIAEIWEAAQATGYEFEVPRWIDGEPVTVCVGCHELTKDDVAALSSIERGIYHRERARWAKVEAECERLAAEADPFEQAPGRDVFRVAVGVDAMHAAHRKGVFHQRGGSLGGVALALVGRVQDIAQFAGQPFQRLDLVHGCIGGIQNTRRGIKSQITCKMFFQFMKKFGVKGHKEILICNAQNVKRKDSDDFAITRVFTQLQITNHTYFALP